MQGDLVFSANSADVLSALCVLGFCFAKSGKIHWAAAPDSHPPDHLWNHRFRGI